MVSWEGKMNPDTNQFEQLKEFRKQFEDQQKGSTKQDDEFIKMALQKGEQLQKGASLTSELDRATLVRPDGSPVPDHWPIFKVGEEVTIKGYVFRVGYIGESTLLLEPMRMAP
jgi:hypothetical protein